MCVDVSVVCQFLVLFQLENVKLGQLDPRCQLGVVFFSVKLLELFCKRINKKFCMSQ